MTETHIGAEQFRRQLTDLLNRVSYGGEHLIIERHGTALAAVIPFQIYESVLAADLGNQATAIGTNNSSPEELAAEIEAILQSNALVYPQPTEQLLSKEAPVLREQAQAYYEVPSLSAAFAPNSTFTLEEVAMYLKLPIDAVAKSAAQGEIPGRRINNTWRFLKTTIDNWLGNSDGRQVLLQQAGAFADDESLAELRRQIYQERGRSEVAAPDEVQP